MGTMLQDLQYGMRMLRKNPGFTVVAVLTLALGIGANTAIFSVIDAVLLKRLPYPGSSNLAMVWEQNPERGWFHNIVSAANFVDWRKENHVFSAMSAIDEGTYNLSGDGEPQEVNGEQVSANFFGVLGVEPALGRTFRPDEDGPKGPTVAVLSNALWKQRYGGDPGIVGRTINLDRKPFTVVGVMPKSFYFPPKGDRAGLWIAGPDLTQPERTWHNFKTVARLRPGITLRQAQAEMDSLARALEQKYPQQKGWGVQLVSLHDETVGDTRPALLVLLAAVGMVLLISCANLANLQLARVAARQKEIAVRSALGAGRGKVIRQILTESVLLGVIGGGLGLVLASWGVRLLVALAPQDTPGLAQASVNLGVLLFAFALSVATGVAFGLAPAFGAARVDLNQTLKESSRGSTEGAQQHGLRSLLVSCEFALALVLLVGAGLLIRTFVALNHADLGFDPENVLTMRIALEGPAYAQQRQHAEFFRKLLERVESLPGVTSAAVVDGGGLPPDGGSGDGFTVVGRPVPAEYAMPDAVNRVISPDYFKTMGIALLRGRAFTDADNESAPRVVIINERLAKDFWPGGDPIGSQLQFRGIELATHGPRPKEPAKFTIVGVVKGEKNRGLEVPPAEAVYMPYSQEPRYYNPRVLLVKTSENPTLMTESIRHEVSALDPEQPIAEIQTMEQVVSQARAVHRFSMILLGLFAGLALLLAAVGIYGVMSYSVTQRMHEIGIRMALGAARRHVLGTVLGRAMRLAAIGIAVGVAGALLAARAMSGVVSGLSPTDPHLLYGVSATDWLTFVAVTVVLTAVGLLAGYLPARRALRVDPLAALRYE